jgi:hypothetical protein
MCGVATRAHAQTYDCAPHVNAPDREAEARKLFDEALGLEQAQPERALDILDCARRLADRPAVSLRIGTIAERLGKLELAIEGYERYLKLAGDLAPDRIPLQKRIDALHDKLEEREEQADPTLGVAPIERRKQEKSPLPGYIVAGAGGVLMLVGGVFLYSAKQQNDEVHDIEPGTTFWNSEDAKDKLDGAKRSQTIGLVSLGVGAIVTGVGVYLVLDARRSISAGARVGTRSAQSYMRFAF